LKPSAATCREMGVPSTFPTGKQNGLVLKDLYLIHRSAVKIHLYMQNIEKLNTYNILSSLFAINQGLILLKRLRSCL
jgi:hypothetical protein